MLSIEEIDASFGGSHNFQKLRRSETSFVRMIEYIHSKYFREMDPMTLRIEIESRLISDADVYRYLRTLKADVVEHDLTSTVNEMIMRYSSEDFREMSVLAINAKLDEGEYGRIDHVPNGTYDLVVVKDHDVDESIINSVGRWLIITDTKPQNDMDKIGMKIAHHLDHGIITGSPSAMRSYEPFDHDLEVKATKMIPSFNGRFMTLMKKPERSSTSLPLTSFIPYYEPEKMSVKKEFRELMINPTDPYHRDTFFSKYQELPARWFSPYTGNMTAFIRWSVGVGKTRGALKWALSWLNNGHYTNVIFLSGSKLITRTIGDELVNYFRFFETLDENEYKKGRRSHGRTIAITRFINRQGFLSDTITTFINSIISEHAQSGSGVSLESFIQAKYRNYAVIIDEVHLARRTNDDKKLYNNLMLFLDAVRGVSPILLLSATPVIDTWYDIVSVIGMLYPPEEREMISREFDALSRQHPDEAQLKHLVTKYMKNIVSDRNPIGLPGKVMVPSPLNFRDGEFIKYSIDGEFIADSLYPVIMSSEQTETTTKAEAGLSESGEERPSDFFTYQRTLYDFTFSAEDVGNYVIMDPIKQEYIVNPSAQAFINSAGEVENKFLVYWRDPNPGELDRWNTILKEYYQKYDLDPNEFGFLGEDTKFVDTTRGLGLYSAKNAELIWMTKYHPMIRDKPGYVHTLWVKNGTENIAGSFVTNGWRYWNGNQEWNMDVVPTKPMFVIISGGSKQSSPNRLNNILKLYNHEKNRDGKYLRLVIGSKASGISLSLSNGRFFIELSFDYNRTTLIQSEGRVFRRDSLLHLKDRRVFVAYMIGLPKYLDNEYNNAPPDEDERQYYSDIENGIITSKLYPPYQKHEDYYPINPRTTEIHIYNISRKKYRYTEAVYEAIEDASIEKTIASDMHLPEDDSTHALLYADTTPIRDEMARHFLDHWNYKIDDRYKMLAAADLISSNTLMTSRNGIPFPVMASADGVSVGSFNFDPSISSVGNLPVISPFSRVYDDRGIYSEDKYTYNDTMTSNIIDALRKRVFTSDYDFVSYILAASDIIKIIYLELAIAGHPDVPLDIRRRILDLFKLYWNTYSDQSVVHILWYAVQPKAYNTKKGINAALSGETRKSTITLIGDQMIVSKDWVTINTEATESIYFSNFNNRVMAEEERVKMNTFKYFGERIINGREYGWFLFVSVSDGKLRLREIYDKDLRKRKTYLLEYVLDPYYRDVINEIFSIAGEYFDEKNYQQKLFEICQSNGILLIK